MSTTPHLSPLSPERVPWTLPSKLAQAVVAVLFGVPALYGLLLLGLDATDWPGWSQLPTLLHLVPLVPVVVAPLVVRASWWWTVSVLSATAYVAYLALQAVIITDTYPPLTQFWLVPFSVLVPVHLPALVLLGVALLIAPGDLRAGRAGRRAAPVTAAPSDT